MTDQIIFHVGAPKTGSTYLQRRLVHNSAILRQHGICYPVKPEFERIAANAKLITFGIDPLKADGFRQAFPAFDVEKLNPADEFEALLAECPPDTKTVILSSEGMLPRYARNLADVIPASARTTITLVVRRQDDWIESFFNQGVKNNAMKSIDDTVALAINGGDVLSCQPDWWDHYQSWSAHFERCDVLFYDQKAPELW